MLLNLLLIIVSLGLLVLGAEWLVKGASSLAAKLKVSALVIGLTVVAFGTSMPELTVSVTASLQGSADIALGNVLGSNIANILLILGVCGILGNLKVKSSTVYKEIPLMLAGTVLLFAVANDVFLDDGTTNAITRTDGITLLIMFAIFMYYVFSLTKTDKQTQVASESEPISTYGLPLSIGFIGSGLLLLVFGGRLLVDNAVSVAQSAGLSEALIGLTIVAIGTSLPELATSVVAVRRKHNDIAVGNVVGSNIFNIFWILGLSSVITSIPVANGANADFLVAIVAALLLFVIMFVGRKHTITMKEGVVFLLLYAGYTVFLIARG